LKGSRDVVKGGAPSVNQKRLAIVLTVLGVIGTIGLSIHWVIDGSMLIGLLALVSALVLAVGVILLKPPRIVEEEL